MINELLPAAITGVILGLLFFGGLYWTVRMALGAKLPALWFLLSLMLRTGIVLSGFYLVSAGDFRRLLAALAGFIAARIIVSRLTKPGARTCI